MDTTESPALRAVIFFALAATLAVTFALVGYTPAALSDSALAVDAEAVRTALASEPDESVGADEIAFFTTRLHDDPSDVLAMRRLAGAHLLRFRATGDQAELDAVDRLTGAMEARDPSDPAMHAARASWALSAHRFPEAVEAARARRSFGDPSNEGGALQLFDALWASGEYAEAQDLLTSRRFERRSIGVLSREARLVDGLGDTEGARDRMVRVVELVDAYAEAPVIRAWARVELGNFTLHAGDPDGAVEQYLDALRILPGYASALEALAWVAWGVDESPVAAAALFARSLANGGHLDIMPVLAEIAQARGRTAEAEGLRTAFIEEASATAGAERLYLRPLAQELADDSEMLDRALELAQRDLEQRTDRGAWATRGWVLSRMGRHEEAMADARRAVAWGSPPPEVLWRAGTILHEAGETREGEALLRDALEGRIELGPVVSAEILARLSNGAR